MKKFGIDLSRWQKGFDIEKAKKSGVEFVILKIGGGDDGLYKDSCFNDFYTQCKKIGMPVGCYYFGKALTMEQAKKEAEHFNSLVSGKQFEYPVFYDVEADMLKVGKEKLTEICKHVLNYLENLGYWVGIYGSVDNLQDSLDDTQLKKYTHWGAAWSETKPSFKSGSELQLWQFGSDEKNQIRSRIINGYAVDQDYCYVDFPALIKEKGLNGYGNPGESKEDVKESVRTLKKGCKGDDVKELQENLNKVIKAGLSVDGSFGSLTDSAVRKFQEEYGLEVDGSFGHKSREKMQKCLKECNELKVGAFVKIKTGAKDLNSKKKFASFVYNKTYKVIRINGDKVVFGINNVITGVVSKNDIVLV